MINPYELPVPANGSSPISRARQLLEPFIAEHMEGFGPALEGRVQNHEQALKRVRAHMYLRVGMAAARQAQHVAHVHAARARPMAMAMEATTASSTLVADITSFITQMIHMSLDVYPRLIAPNFVSVQPFTQPSGYVFFLHRHASNDSDRRLDDLSTFDKTYGDRGDFGSPSEGTQVKAVNHTLTKSLVEVKYKALMHQHSHEVDVALRSQYGIDIGMLGDIATADELAWEVDREIVDDLTLYSESNDDGIVYFDDDKGGTYDSLTTTEQQAYDKKFVRDTLTSVGVDMSAKVFRRPNWYLCGTNVTKLLARTPEALAEDISADYFDQAITKGSIIETGRMRTGQRVWHDPQMDANTMIAGFVDNMNPFYAGYIYCPFGLASLLTAAFTDPDVLLTKKSRALAFAKVGVRANQFRKIKLGTAS